jgi:hypothetical protein
VRPLRQTLPRHQLGCRLPARGTTGTSSCRPLRNKPSGRPPTTHVRPGACHRRRPRRPGK